MKIKPTPPPPPEKKGADELMESQQPPSYDYNQNSPSPGSNAPAPDNSEELTNLDPKSKKLLMGAMRRITNPDLPMPRLKGELQLMGKAKGAHSLWSNLKEEWKQKGGDSLQLGKGVLASFEKAKGKGKGKLPTTNNPLREELAALSEDLKPSEKGKITLTKEKGETALGDVAGDIKGEASGGQISLQGMDAGGVAGSGEATLSSQVDKIIDAFQQGQYGAHLVGVKASALESGETRISVTLSNGMQVDVDLAAGGKDLNIYVKGLTPEQQRLIDTQQAHNRLRESLSERGFSVHLIQTERGEGGGFTGTNLSQEEQSGQLGRQEEEPREGDKEGGSAQEEELDE